ncbi:ejaculatory bulb-specific protein 3 [Cephus cinctus]|uniref:Ejaculatory bulb-specific protein 3 n=1 Tax=Cephus cinctus TaxID=211228 RepID=A0AAJ7BV23_CEPCN|nr:ejaculatory bulb-specific protein 3 [Cephus cinctus]
MKTQVLFCILFIGFLGLCQAQDITLLLNNRPYVEREISCVLGRGPCDLVGKQIIALLPEALNNNCARCNRQDAANARKLIQFMMYNYPNQWREIVQRYSVRHG